MARPRPPRVTPAVDPDDDVDIHPAELRRLQKEFLSRIDHLVAGFERKSRAYRPDAAPTPPDEPPFAPEDQAPGPEA